MQQIAKPVEVIEYRRHKKLSKGSFSQWKDSFAHTARPPRQPHRGELNELFMHGAAALEYFARRQGPGSGRRMAPAVPVVRPAPAAVRGSREEELATHRRDENHRFEL